MLPNRRCTHFSFAGGNVGHYASLMAYLAENHRVYAVDLLGFGASDKPLDADYGPDLWGELVRDFTQEFAGEGALIVGNSIGSLAVLSAASMLDEKAISGIVLLNCAGAMNRKGLEKDDALLRAISPIFVGVEYLLQRPRIANYLFNRFRSKQNVKTILSQQAYVNKDAVTDELVDILHLPSEDPGALQVFVKVFTNEPGPRPETLMPSINAPLLLLWGDKDRWTPANGKVANYFRKLGEERGNVSVEVLADVGHCPHDDRPDLVADRISSFVEALDQ
jgi:pimeloyl-ACP methyl ester carboxylesterase